MMLAAWPHLATLVQDVIQKTAKTSKHDPELNTGKPLKAKISNPLSR